MIPRLGRPRRGRLAAAFAPLAVSFASLVAFASVPVAASSASAPAPGAPPAAGTADGAAGGRDWHTHANIDGFRVRHLDLDLAVDFAARRLAGHADLTLERVAPDATRVVLDTNGLEIRHAWLLDGGARTRVPFELGARDAVLGRPLTLTLPAAAAGRGEVRVRIEYATSPDARGLQWLTPAQTAGGKQPFLFSQSQSIYARTWIPLQDTACRSRCAR
jgi:aminopeptidase N